MSQTKAIAIVGVGAVLPDAHNVEQFWKNVKSGRYSITDVPSNRWREDLYYHPDPSVPDKTYSKIGGWVKDFNFEPLKWGIPIPLSVTTAMDEAQKWAIAASRQALADYGYPQRSLNPERVAVILGNAMSGENHYNSSLRIRLWEVMDTLASLDSFKGLSNDVQQNLLQGLEKNFRAGIPEISEDTMPGELSNIIAGRVANVFNLAGPNFVTDAACASSLAALQAAIEGLIDYQFDAVLTGGVDRNMGAETFVKFCKIGALSPDGSRPYADGANGFVMGEGSAILLLKRLADAERDGDKIYAVIRGIGSSSDGKGKGITAPNPVGQERALERAWKDAGVSPASVGMIEGHGTSTKVGDVVEVNSLNKVFGVFGLPTGYIALGSVKSNIGHLKSAAGAVGLLKVALALQEQILPPNTNFHKPNPNIDFAHIPFAVNTQLRPWERQPGEIRRAGVSSFGFGGSNFHAVVEEHIPGLLTDPKVYTGISMNNEANITPQDTHSQPIRLTARGAFFIGASTKEELAWRLNQALVSTRDGASLDNYQPDPAGIDQPERLCIDYSDRDDLIKRLEKTLQVLDNETATAWQALGAQGVFRGKGQAGKLAFLFPGQGSQYINMLRDLNSREPVVAETIREADAVMTPILKRPLSSYIFIDGDEAALKAAEGELRNTEITQPAVLTANVAILRLLAEYGYRPDMVIGHSLGEYAALVAAGVLTFPEALEVVSARGREMAKVSVADNGCMAAITAPIETVEQILKTIDGYVVIANINAPAQCVIGGATAAVDKAIVAFQAANFQAVKIPVSHAFHTQIVAPASQPLRKVIERMSVKTPTLTIAANVTGELYPTQREDILDILAQQVASPVQFIRGIQTLYNQGARVFVEAGPKRVLSTLVLEILKGKTDITLLATNHPRKGDLVSFNEALCGLFAAGVTPRPAANNAKPQETITVNSEKTTPVPSISHASNGRLPLTGSVVISGAGLGLPNRNGHVFEDDNVNRLLRGEVMIESLPLETRQGMLAKRITRLVKSPAGAEMVEVNDIEETIKLAGMRGHFDLEEEFGVPADRIDSYDVSTQLAIGAGIEALRDAGIPLVMNYRKTSVGSFLPNRWQLPDALADETGVIFASAFPGMDRMAEEARNYYEYEHILKQIADLKELASLAPNGDGALGKALAERIKTLDEQLNKLDYHFDRRFLFRILVMGHSQFAEYIGARGPNTHVNAACSSTTHAVAIAEDWIRTGRCRRVVVVAGDDITSDNLAHWIGAGFLASGAATMEGDIRLAALPFDRRRNGLIMGMGAAALVVEAEDAVRERGMHAICEVLSSQIANSAFHGTRLDVTHVSDVMNRVISQAEERFNIQRSEIAGQTVFVSHETYTPARGGSAAAEIHALRQTFGDQASQVIIANTKGYTGHTMGAGVEDVLAVKALQLGAVPRVANLDAQFEPDPDLGDLRLSQGGHYDVQYSLRLGAGFGSQIAMTLFRRIPGTATRVNESVYDGWLSKIAGYPEAKTEIVKRTLRICDQGAPKTAPARSSWQFGVGPTAWADKPGETITGTATPAPQVQTTKPVQASTPASAVPAAAHTGSQPNSESIKTYVLSVVSEKTGYPVEMLDMNLDLEADLGIDTVKQAELFATIREHYNIPRREDLRLSDFNTLTKVVQFMQDALGGGTTSETQPQTATPMAAPTTGDESIKSYVLSVVSEKTGYPAEMLDMNLDLEADLGIDTVKQAELFAAIREHYNIPRREDLRLSDFNTLTKVVQFMQDALGDGTTGETQPQAAAPVAAPTAGDESIQTYVLSVVSEKTGYPTEMLDMNLDLEADLGIDTVKQAELFATIREHYNIPRREDLRLSDFNTLTKVVQFMQDALGGQPATPAEKQVEISAPAKIQAAATPAQPAPSSAETDAIKAYVLSVVSEKTGYPTEMLDMNLDLEADLGIDTVKQAELFATIREHYNIPRREDLRLADFNTLTKVVQFMQDALSEKEKKAATPAAPESTTAEAGQGTAAKEKGDGEHVTIRRRIPLPVLRTRLDICQPTGVQLEAGSRVIVVSDQGKAGEALAKRLRSRKVEVILLKEPTPELASEKINKAIQEGPLQGLYFLPALDVEKPLNEMALEDWNAGMERRIYVLYELARQLPSDAFLICATRFGGLHGYGPGGAIAPLGGLVSGFSKALMRERKDAFVKVVDSATQTPATIVAERLIAETLQDPGTVEIGYEGDQRFGITLVDRPSASESKLTLDKDSVFVISGGAGGITALIALDLARRTQGTFYLLEYAPLPDANNPDLKRVKTDRNGLMHEMMQRSIASGDKTTPAQIEQKLSALERAAAVLDVIRQIDETGGKARYVVCDVTNADAVQHAVQEIAGEAKHVDVFIHAAGIERSRKLENKPVEEFRQTIGIKANGFYNLYSALWSNNCAPKAIVTFSSIAGRFGNSGQTDYSSANDLLCKLVYAVKRENPEIIAMSIDWGAWAKVGMSSRGHIPDLMKMAGIEMLDPDDAIPTVYRELTAGTCGEIVIAGALGILDAPARADGGVNLELANQALTAGKPIHVMLSRLTGLDANQGILLEAELDPKTEPFLKDHAMNGIPILPGVMGIEGFSVVSQHIASMLGTAKGSFRISKLEDVQFQAPFKFYRDEPRRVTWKALTVREDSGLVVHVILESTVARVTKRIDRMQHFSGKVYLEPQEAPLSVSTVKPPQWNGEYTVQPEDIYKLYFHGPAFQVLDGVQRSGDNVLGRLRQDLPPISAGEEAFVTRPILIELVLQTAGIWEAGSTGALALPQSIGKLTLYNPVPSKLPIFAEVRPRKDETGRITFDARVVDSKGHVYLELKDYQTIPLPYSVDQELVKPFQGLTSKN